MCVTLVCYDKPMAQDHFERHNHHAGVIDWNFNVTFEGEASVAAMADGYKLFLSRPELYAPIPAQWLHATILRIGTADEYKEAEMLSVAELVQERVGSLNLPEFHFGAPKILFGNVCFPIEPSPELEKLYTIVTESLQQIVGQARATKSPYGSFIAHSSFVYTKARDNEAETEAMLAGVDIPPARFRIRHMPLIRQRPVDGHYEWEVVRDISVR
jgi:hypothetical protein